MLVLPQANLLDLPKCFVVALGALTDQIPALRIEKRPEIVLEMNEIFTKCMPSFPIYLVRFVF